MQDKYNLRQYINLESLFVLFIFCNPTDNFNIADGWVFMLAALLVRPSVNVG